MKINCALCDYPQYLPVSAEQVARWRSSGDYVQVAFPDLSANQREMLVSGTCGVCWDKMFPPEDDDSCNGVCMFAADIGLPEYGDVVAYAHPDCPEHGNPSD